ncbi:MAG: hypothetical protein LBP78_01470 [Acidaminococcales bacterium]|jgi:hypothetical protein|nr:hypothetical protein [Acidaminococcales bacterium]
MNEFFMVWQTLTLLLMGVIGYFLKKLHERIDRDMAEQKSELAALRGEITSLKTSLPLNYVLREDYIRNTANLDHKLDRLLEASRAGH